MNHVAMGGRYSQEVDAIRRVIDAQPRPAFVTGFEVELGEFDGTEAMWVTIAFDEDDAGETAFRERVSSLGSYREALQSVLLREFERYPYFRFRDAAASSAEAR